MAAICLSSPTLSLPPPKQGFKQGNHVNFALDRTITTLPIQSCNSFPRIGKDRRRCLVRRAMVSSVEGDRIVEESASTGTSSNGNDIWVVSIHHVGLLCENLEKPLEVYQNLLGLKDK